MLKLKLFRECNPKHAQIHQRFVNLLKNGTVPDLLYKNLRWRRALIGWARRHLHPLATGASSALPLAERPAFFRALLHLGQAAPASALTSNLPSPQEEKADDFRHRTQLRELLRMFFIGIFCSSWPGNILTMLHSCVNSLMISTITKPRFPYFFFFFVANNLTDELFLRSDRTHFCSLGALADYCVL